MYFELIFGRWEYWLYFDILFVNVNENWSFSSELPESMLRLKPLWYVLRSIADFEWMLFGSGLFFL
jgi:hypothetical protein